MKSIPVKPSVAHHLETRWQVLMSVENFQNDVKNTSKKIHGLSKELIVNYEKAVGFLKADLDISQNKKAEDHLMNIRVHANHLNHALDLISEPHLQNENHPALSDQIKIYVHRLSRLRESALALENLGNEHLAKEERAIWQEKYCLYDKFYAEKFKQQTTFLKLINEFYERFSPKELEQIAKIIAENRIENSDEKYNEMYEKQYLKAIAQFRREFHPQNLWDTILEILSGGVHPSPEEKMMLNQWIEGKPKEKPGGLEEIV